MQTSHNHRSAKLTAANPGATPVYRTIALAGALWFCFAFVLVHFVRDDLSLWNRTLSMYAVGPAGWVLTLGFYSIMITQLMIAYHLFRSGRSTADFIATVLLVLAAAGILLVAIFPYPVKLPHNTGAALQLGLFPLFLLMHAVLYRDDLLRRFTLACALLSLAFFLLLVWNGETDLNVGSVGMAQKSQIIVNTLWLVVYSWCLPATKQSEASRS